MHNDIPVVKDLVLIGGGHSHVAVLKRFGMRPLPGLRITLITRELDTPYSGMLPGFLAGHYGYDECHIDLRPLVQFAGARLFHAPAQGLDLTGRRVLCANRPAVHYDVLSINIGSRPGVVQVPGAQDAALPVKPIDEFLSGWEKLLARAGAHAGRFRLVVVGAGAGGVELSLATQHRLRRVRADAGQPVQGLEHHLIGDADTILPTHGPGVRARFERVLRERGVQVHTGHRVTRVDADAVHCDNGARAPFDALLWTTNASAPAWLKESGLAVDASGFIAVDPDLQSLSHPGVFAAGDIAAVMRYPREKSGVFAVRQGPPLARNLRRALRGRTPRAFRPQKNFLGLISTGDRYAVASRGGWSLEGAWVWRLKDWIDRRFMDKFNNLPEMDPGEGPGVDRRLAGEEVLREISAVAMRCGGCGAKVGSTVLGRVVNELTPVSRDDVLVGLNEPDDAAIIEVPEGKVMVQSVDYFRSFLDDPWVFGQIAANHALSDIFAMGAEAQTAMAVATVPYGREEVVTETLRQLMGGALEVLNVANAALVGGHSSEGAELAFGLSVTGLVDREHLLRKGGMQAGDVLLLTKALGTGTLFAADMRHKARGRWVHGAIETMLQSNQAAGLCLYRHGATACTDVTGFGLLGHLVEMVRPSGCDVELDLNAVPVLDGALETIRAGVFSSLQPQNLRLRRALRSVNGAAEHPHYPILFDPQTAGGLLASVPEERAGQCLAELQALGYTGTVFVGRVRPGSDALEAITLKL